MVQSAVTPTIVAGVCDPGIPTTTALREAGDNAGPIAARAEAPECCPKTDKAFRVGVPMRKALFVRESAPFR
jgi:hypothetical protein